MSKLKELENLGQVIWYDYIRRNIINSGALQEIIDGGVKGLTSNPTIFEKAIAGSSDYDVALKRFVKEGRSVNEVYEALALEDIVRVADMLKPIYQSTRTQDGYISLEVRPTLANDTEETISEAKRLFTTLNRANVMIKVPATPAGIPAIEALIEAGVNVNVTLIFGLQNYQAVANAYIRGVEKLAEAGPTVPGGNPVDQIASVASFFVSRIDTAVDAALEKLNCQELQGKIAIANAKIAYAEFQKIFNESRWQTLAKKGAKVQRLLWASTGTKNPAYSATLYVDELIGADTVNTVPPATLNTFLESGTPLTTLTEGVEQANADLQRLNALGISLSDITTQLQKEGVAAFANSFELLINSISKKRNMINE